MLRLGGPCLLTQGPEQGLRPRHRLNCGAVSPANWARTLEGPSLGPMHVAPTYISLAKSNLQVLRMLTSTRFPDGADPKGWEVKWCPNSGV